MNVINQLLENEKFSPTERVIVDYILDHRDEISHLTIHELALKTASSNPVIIRLCKKLGLEGFRDFKVTFTRDLEKYRQSKTRVDVNYPFSIHENAMEVANNLAMLTKTTVESCYQNLDHYEMNRIAKVLNEANHIYLFAKGDSYIRSLSFKNKMLKIGKQVIDASSLGEDAYYCSNSTSKDCAMFISYSGGTNNYAYYMHLLKRNQTPIIALSANPSSLLVKEANYTLTFPDLEDPIDSIATFYSQIAIDYLLNVVYSLVYSLNYQKNKQIKNGKVKQTHTKK